MRAAHGPDAPPTHGGPDALGVPECDFSSNANACGPWPVAEQAVRAADARHYPDPAYTALSRQLAHWHGVAPDRIVLAASASEFIQRISTAVALAAAPGAARVWLPPHAYGDYARAAAAAGLPRTGEATQAALLWACEPSSPLGQAQPGLADQVAALRPGQALVLDQAYEPLRLQGAPSLGAAALACVWRLVTPNKALGLTGVRAAYAIAPQAAHVAQAALIARVRALAPSWPLGVHGVALLQCWATPAAQHWLAATRQTLSGWQQRQRVLLQALGWCVEPGDANFMVATPGLSASPWPSAQLGPALAALRRSGIKLRDCASFGLPGKVRLAVAPPEQQDRLAAAWQALAAARSGQGAVASSDNTGT